MLSRLVFVAILQGRPVVECNSIPRVLESGYIHFYFLFSSVLKIQSTNNETDESKGNYTFMFAKVYGFKL